MKSGNLILTRKIGERVIIGKNIIVEVTDIDGKQVRLSFNAPQDVSVDREELHERKHNEASQE